MTTLDQISMEMNREERKLWMLLLSSAAVIVVGVGTLLYLANEPAFNHLKLARTKVSGKRSSGSQNQGTSEAGRKAPEEVGFAQAIGRLDAAFQRHSGVSAEELILQANTNPDARAGAAEPCPFLSQGDGLALVVSENGEGRFTLADTISSCAESIDRLP